MLDKIDITWNNNFKNDGLLYFYQRIVEMLDYTTVDIYRAPLLNTHRLITEYLKISNSSIKKYNLEEVYAEFIDSFQSDVILQYKLKENKIKQIMQHLNNQNLRQEIMLFLAHSIGDNYLNWIKEYLLEIIPTAKNKSKIERASRCFISELLHYGYSRDDIYHYTRRILKSNTIEDTSLQLYLGHFNCCKQKYDVYFSISNTLLQFQETLSTKMGFIFEDDGNFKKLDVHAGNSVVKIPNVMALDPSTAAQTAYSQMKLFTTFYQYFGNYTQNIIQCNALVINSKETIQHLVVNREKYNSIEDENPPKIGRLSESVINRLITRARCSLPQLEKITQIHNRAISNNGLENGFLNLWSILEMICVQNQESSKISQVIKVSVPILKCDYLSVIFSDIRNNLKSILDEKEYVALISSIKDGSTDYEKIASFLLLPKYSKDVDNFVDCLVNYPVLRSRILNLHDNYTQRKELNILMEKYAQRITWHLHRIYRARNTITHAGKTPNDLKDLGEHLHTYVDSVVNEIIIKLSLGTLCHPSNVLVDSELCHENYNSYFQENKSIDLEGIKLIFSLDNIWI